MIDMENIYLDMEASSYQEVLGKVADILFETGHVKETYKEALLKREEHSPTGLPVKPWGVAIPHTDAEHVINPCIIVVKLKNTVEFKEMGNPNSSVVVGCVVGLVFQDAKNQIPLLSSVMGLATDKELMQQLKETTTKEEVFSLLATHFKDM